MLEVSVLLGLHPKIQSQVAHGKAETWEVSRSRKEEKKVIQVPALWHPPG